MLWNEYLQKQHRLPTLFELIEKDKITDKEFWAELAAVWVNSESTEEPSNLDRFYKIIARIGTLNRPHLLNPFHKPVSCYRGGDYEEIIQPSWSTDRNVAKKFVFMYPVPKPAFFSGKIDPNNIIFYTNLRAEKELIVFPGTVRISKVVRHEWTDVNNYHLVYNRNKAQQGGFDSPEVYAAFLSLQPEHKQAAIDHCRAALDKFKLWGITTPVAYWEERLNAILFYKKPVDKV